MKCPTCHFNITTPMHFCPHCGWPAARLTVEIPGNVLGVSNSGQAAIPFLLRNVGAGYVEYSLSIADEQPWAYFILPQNQRSAKVAERRLRPGATDNSLRVGVTGGEVPVDADHIMVNIDSSDQGGRSPEHFRPWQVAGNRWRKWQVHVPIQHLGESEVYIGQSLIIFTTRAREAQLRVVNLGGTPARIKLSGLPQSVRGTWTTPAPGPTPGDVLEISFDEEPVFVNNALEPQSVPSDGSLTLSLRADDSFEGIAEAEIASGGGKAHKLVLFGEAAPHSAGLVKHWTVGIDFGTAKSAVYYTDNWVSVEQREPNPVLWPAGPSSTERTETTTRSAAIFQSHTDVPQCGHHVPVSAGAEGEGQLVVESMKTRLRGDTVNQPVKLPSGSEVSPVGIVAEFMRYLIEEVRASDPFRGRMDMDARLVLTLPVMEDRDAFGAQRENTLAAAKAAGLPIPDLLTPSEPECAALDLMHSLRRGDYTFNEKVYYLQDNEIIMVFDCGAGTTDIAALRVQLGNGSFEAEQLCAAGYRFGGDTVDDLLLSWMLDRRADQLQVGWIKSGMAFKVGDLDQPIPLHAARDEARRLKESLFAPGAPAEPRTFHTDLGTFELGPSHVSRLIVPFMDTIFNVGVMPDPRLFFPALDAKMDDRMRAALWREMVHTARLRVKTLDTALREAGLNRGQVTFLFITGGTGQIGIIPSRLYDFMGRSARIVVATPEDCTVNVARGASLYYDYRVSGILRCAVDIVGRDPATGREIFRERACDPGALPGLELERAVRIGPRQAVEVALAASYPDGGPDGDIAASIVRNPSADTRQTVVRVEYSSDRTLYWEAEFADGQVVIGHEAVLSL